jgi:cytochrome c2
MQNRHTECRVVPFIACMFVLWAVVIYQNADAAGQAPGTQTAGAPRVDQAQIDKGRQAVGQVCAACHANIARMIQVQKKTTDQWRDTVYSMIGRGAHVMPDEIEPLTQYLAANAGRPAAAAPAGAAQSQAAPAPNTSAGRAILEANCQACHDLGTATRKPANVEWAAVVERMISYGARLTPTEQQTLVAHLSTLP